MQIKEWLISAWNEGNCNADLRVPLLAGQPEQSN
jgi:hypothetical protein